MSSEVDEALTSFGVKSVAETKVCKQILQTKLACKLVITTLSLQQLQLNAKSLRNSFNSLIFCIQAARQLKPNYSSV
jgi:hypothetical protein